MIGFADGTADDVRWMTHGGIHAYASPYPLDIVARKSLALPPTLTYIVIHGS
jgi:hypothetical protein